MRNTTDIVSSERRTAFIPRSNRGATQFESAYGAYTLNLAIMLYTICFFGGAAALFAFAYLTRNINF